MDAFHKMQVSFGLISAYGMEIGVREKMRSSVHLAMRLVHFKPANRNVNVLCRIKGFTTIPASIHAFMMLEQSALPEYATELSVFRMFSRSLNTSTLSIVVSAILFRPFFFLFECSECAYEENYHFMADETTEGEKCNTTCKEIFSHVCTDQNPQAFCKTKDPTILSLDEFACQGKNVKEIIRAESSY